jgi:hypothetical protein
MNIVIAISWRVSAMLCKQGDKQFVCLFDVLVKGQLQEDTSEFNHGSNDCEPTIRLNCSAIVGKP